MIVALVPLVVCVLGLLTYALASNAKAAEAGRLAYACGLLVVLLAVAHKWVRL